MCDITVNDRVYKSITFRLIENLCVDVILGNEFQRLHKSVTFEYGGTLPPLNICGLSTLNVDPVEPFSNLQKDYKPVATKSRRYSKPDQDFIKSEIQSLLTEGVIESSNSPWRAQVVVTKDHPNRRKRLAIDYSQTINRYTQLDAYPIPRVDDFVNKVAQ